MDGKKGGNQVSMSIGAMMGVGPMSSNAATSGLATAMTGFLNSSANVSGLAPGDMAGLMQKLNSASGKI